MFQATRRRLALWYTGVTAVLLLLFATGFYIYVRMTLVERVDDTLNHVVEVIERSLVIESETSPDSFNGATSNSGDSLLHVNVEASFRNNDNTTEDDHIDLEWFSPTGQLLWSTLEQPLDIPLHLNPRGETVHVRNEQLLRQITQRVEVGRQVLGYLRVSHPWFEVTTPIRRLIRDLALGTALMVGTVATVGWLLSGLAIAPIRESYHRLKQFTADASHELRSPIAVIQTNVQVALADPHADPEFMHEQLRVVERITRRLGRLVDDLLFLARQDSRIVQKSTPVSVYGLLVDVIHEQQAIAQDKGVELAFERPNLAGDRFPAQSRSEPKTDAQTSQAEGPMASPLCFVQGDADQLRRLFTNLISNAIGYTPTAGWVRIALDLVPHNHGLTTADSVHIKVCDSGVGIAPDDLPHIFDRFYRADRARTSLYTPSTSKATTSTSTGSGLGLAIAKAIVDNHRGHIRVESQPGEGTTVIVTLPGTAQAAESLGQSFPDSGESSSALLGSLGSPSGSD